MTICNPKSNTFLSSIGPYPIELNHKFNKFFSKAANIKPLDELSGSKKIELNFEIEKQPLFTKKNPTIAEGLALRANDKAPSHEHHDIKLINNFLSNPNSVFIFLQKIEDDLEENARKHNQLDGKKLNGFEPNKPYKHNKLLSSYLRKQAEDNGFSGYTRLTGFLNESEFCHMLRQGSLFKDKIFRGTIHGDYTHFMQWLLIIKWNNEDPATPKLSTKPADLFKWIGMQENAIHIWSTSFEKRDIFLPALDFGEVSKAQEYFLSDACKEKFPIFNQLMVGRANKGARSDISEPGSEKFSTELFKTI